MKGLVLSGGKGTRLRPLTYTGAKQLVPVANKPVLFYALENLVEAGITDIGIIVGETHEQIRAAVEDGSRFGAQVTYIQQEAPLGLAHAVLTAEEFIGGEPFVMFLGDNFIRDGIVSLVEEFRRADVNCMLLLHEVDNPREFGIAELQDGRVVSLVERPQEPKSNLAVVGIYMFDHHIFDAARAIRPSWRGELEITDAIQQLVERGLTVKPHVLTGWWIDTGKKDDMLEANRLILETLKPSIEGRVDEASRIEGPVALEEGAELVNSTVRGPVCIGARTRIINSFIGPFSSIDHDCYIADCEIEHSIVLDGSRIEGLPHRLADSLIGRHVVIRRDDGRPTAYKLMLGDHSDVRVL